MPVLLIHAADALPMEFPVRDRVLIGRGPGCDLTLEDPAVSCHHAMVFRGPGGDYFLRDLNSSNGSRVNGRRVRSARLTGDATIKLGRTRLSFRMGLAEPTVPFRAALPGSALRTDRLDLTEPAGLDLLQDDLHSLCDLGDALRCATSEQELFVAIGWQVVWATRAARVEVLALDRDSGRIEPRMCHPRADRPFGSRPFAPGLLRRVIEQGETVIAPEDSLRGGLRLAADGDEPQRLVLCVPLVSPRGSRGLILVAHEDPGVVFGEPQIRAVTAVGLEGGLALANLDPDARVEEDVFMPTIEALARALELGSGADVGHAQRVADLAVVIARWLELGAHSVSFIRIGALLHDIGKVGLGAEVEQTRGALASPGLAEVRRHPDLGERAIAPLEALAPVRAVIRHHHERFDGRGFPDGLAGPDIPLEARIVAVADALDALTTARPYRDALGLDEALRELERCAGGQLDPMVVDALGRAARAGALGLVLAGRCRSAG
ncbi:MAG: HD domain-containing phosphohydrolase [Pseudomonadota bacterium]